MNDFEAPIKLIVSNFFLSQKLYKVFTEQIIIYFILNQYHKHFWAINELKNRSLFIALIRKMSFQKNFGWKLSPDTNYVD